MDKQIIVAELYAIISANRKHADHGRRHNAEMTMQAVHDVMEYLRDTFKQELNGNYTLTECDKGYNYGISRIIDVLTPVINDQQKED